ncbi:MAG: DUF951 domain-containing protein [Firmicutes bacterium]|nr:DUF951 domain-containing protein [Bacillota bacterium]
MYTVGDKLELRKEHPCGGKIWEVLKAGVDTRIKCLTCGRVILLPREKLLKQIKKTMHK